MGLFKNARLGCFSFNTENKKDVHSHYFDSTFYLTMLAKTIRKKKGRREKINTKHTDYKGKGKTVIIHTHHMFIYGEKILRHLQNS